MKNDPIVKSKRVYKNAQDKANQGALEGADTSFQRSLRMAEAEGKKTFRWRDPKTGKWGVYAARTTSATPLSAPPSVRGLKGGPLGMKPPGGGSLKMRPRREAFPMQEPPETIIDTPPTRGGIFRNFDIFGGTKTQRVNSRKVKNISPTGTKPSKRGRNRGF